MEIVDGFEHGGYAKTSEELLQFTKQFIQQTGILVEPVYTAKALFALKKDIENGMILPHEKILFIHTGGMMGLFSDKMLQLVEN